MRIYLPATLDEVEAAASLPVRTAHAVTAALRLALPDTDEEGLEYAAQLTAADDALAVLAQHPTAPRLRVVVAADVPPASDLGPEQVTAVAIAGPIGRAEIACLLVDEPAAADDVAAALRGDPAARDRLDQRDLLWYDVSEIGRVPRTLGPR